MATNPWVEKHRPKTIDDVSQQQQVISTLRGAVKAGALPHLLFYGPPGTGKTTTILALARNLYGSHMSKRVRLSMLFLYQCTTSDHRALGLACVLIVLLIAFIRCSLLQVLELNASDDRTIEVVRTKIKDFAKGIAGGTNAEGKKLPAFKLIILDEADSMTAGAQV